MSAIDDALRELLTGMQNARIYFAGHDRVAASAISLTRAAAALDPEKGLLLGLRNGILVHGTRPLLEATEQAGTLVKSLDAWGAEGIHLGPDATEEEVLELLRALAFPPSEEEGIETSRLSGPRASLLGPGAVRDDVRDSTETTVSRKWEQARQGRLSICQVLRRTCDDIRENIGIDMDEIGAIAQGLSETIDERPQAALSMVSMKGHDEYTFTHSTNVAIFALTAAKPFVTDTAELSSLAQAALLHDVGKVAVPREVLYKTGSYSPEEWEIMRSHPIRGAEILANTKGVDDFAVMTALCHHIHSNGSGYPRLQIPMRRHPFVSLLSIADVFEALTAERPYKKPMPPVRAVSTIIKEAGRQFEARLVRAFVRAIGIFPVGTCVRLTGGQTGIVSQTSPDNPDLPQVHLVDGSVTCAIDGFVDLASGAARACDLRIVGTLDEKPRMRDLIDACA